jgi:ankyrin repeat protein
MHERPIPMPSATHSFLSCVSAMLLLLLLSACPQKSGENQVQDGQAAEADSAVPATSADAQQSGQDDTASEMDPSEMTWRAFIDPGMSLEEISALSPEEALGKLEELGVPFEQMNYHESIEMDPVELTALFLQAGMGVDELNPSGVSTLQMAAFLKKPKHLELLLERGADIEHEDKVFRSNVVDYAVASGSLQMLKRVLETGADPGGGPDSRPILIDAIISDNLEMFNYVFASYPETTVVDFAGQSPLMFACMVGSLEMVKQLIAAGADLEQAERKGGTPITAAAYLGHWDVVNYMIEVGANPHVSYRGNRNLLFEMAYLKEVPLELADKLIEQGMDIDQKATGNVTPMINAAQNGGIAMVEFLLDRGADHTVVDDNGYSACDYANFTANGELVLIFAKYGITSDVEIPTE